MMEATAFLPVIWVFCLPLRLVRRSILSPSTAAIGPCSVRLNDLAVKFRMGDGAAAGEPMPGGVTQSFVEWAQRRMPDPNLDKPAVEKLVHTLEHAGFEGSAAPKVFQAIRLLATAGGVLLGYLAGAIRGNAIFFMVAGAAFGYLLPLLYVRYLARSRQTKIRRELADVIDLLVVCVECGLGLMAAIRIVGRECERQGRIMGAQLGRLSAELAAGSSLGEGFQAVAQRTGVEDIKTFSAILVQSEKLGTEMAQALRATAEQLRIKRSMRAEEMAQKLPIKMIIPLILFLLPAMMLILAGPPAITIFRNFKFG